MSPRSRVIGILAGAAALVLAAGGVLAYKYYKRPGDQKPYIWTKHWTTLYMDPVYLGPGTSFGVVVRGGAKPWSRTEGTDFRFLVSDQWSPGGIGHLDGENDVYFASLGYYTLGACYVNDDSGKFVLNPSASGSELFDCDVAFNNYVVFWAPGYFNLQNTAAHEFGHALGLAHSEVPGAMMDPIGDFGEAAQFLHEDDEAGEVFLYPPPPGGGRGFPPPAIPLPTKAGTMSNLQVSAPQVMVGDPLEFSARVSNTSGVQLLLQGVETAPVSTGTFEPVVLEPGEVREVTVERTVGGLPGDYETRLRLGGYDPTAVYLAQQTLLSSLVRVRRPAVALPIQDELSGSLGPRGIETVEVFLVKGESFLLDLRGAP
ncbi:MAG: matrixin family metalloprotease, partial [Planctomycetaceae bacterium]|nr:matrixin family metalloprotease [Planctomycetaceae bacterium]